MHSQDFIKNSAQFIKYGDTFKGIAVKTAILKISFQLVPRIYMSFTHFQANEFFLCLFKLQIVSTLLLCHGEFSMAYTHLIHVGVNGMRAWM